MGRFESEETLRKVLTLLDGYHMPEHTYDGLYETVENGLDESMLEATFR